MLNALLAEERSIVAPTPGTTRDTVEEVASIGGIPVRLIDTAGLRPTGGRGGGRGRPARRGGRETRRSRALVLDRASALAGRRPRAPRARLGHPADRRPQQERPRATVSGSAPGDAAGDVVDVSARDGRGLDELRDRILSLLVSGGIPSRNTVLLLDTWERDLLRRIADALGRALAALESGSTPDIAAEELRDALRAAGELQGIDVSESILAQIFSRFCVGK